MWYFHADHDGETKNFRTLGALAKFLGGHFGWIGWAGRKIVRAFPKL